MPTFRVPYPVDPTRRQALFDKAVAKLGGYGSCSGTPDAGSFQAKTPIGELVGTYKSEPGSNEVEFEIAKKPFLVPLAMIQSEARKFVETA
jgi:hypothetical protein